MKWSWKLGEIAGVGIYLHPTFLLLIAWVAVSHWQVGGTLAAALAGVGFTMALFGCVILHELGHALMARRFHIKTHDITLLPIGGVARLERMPDRPLQELWVAVAGPAVSIAIAAVLFGWLQMTARIEPLQGLGVTQGPFLQRLAMLNVLLVAFNCLPAFPMDGGRVLRALLAMRMEYTRATQVAATLGQVFAFLLGFLGLLSNPFLVFIALFVWIGAVQEASMVQFRAALAGIPVSRAMLTDFRTLRAEDTLARALELLLSGSQHDFPVVEDRRIVGVLTRADMLAALAQRSQTTPVSDIMRRDFVVVDSFDMLETAFRQLEGCDCHTLPVSHGGQLVGLLTMDNLGEFLTIQSAVGRALDQRHAA